MIRVTNQINTSAVNCNLPYEQFIGDTDKIIRMVRITDSDGTFAEFKFVGYSKILQVKREWMECTSDLFGEQQCLDNIQKVLKMKTPKGIISREFMKGDILVKQVQNAISTHSAPRSSAIVSVNQTSVCVTTSNYGDLNDYYQIQVDIMTGDPRFQPKLHSEVLTLRGQVLFPGTGKQLGQYGTYCYNIILTSAQLDIYNIIYNNQSQVSSVISFISDNIPVDKLIMQSTSTTTNYMYVLSAVLIIASIVWYFISIRDLRT
ncbi:Hypothetical_protein [Hexamita inflata]|uniref:Hypothetical_protein n=1 Tax=Hexamita inflata TaxID=28002 RepID=A0AA86NG22_9EUKA|nr:Hypothetical protein HINF_LOCUS6154 [Hexamita inflata]